MSLNPKIWQPVSAVLSVANLAAVWFAAAPGRTVARLDPCRAGGGLRSLGAAAGTSPPSRLHRRREPLSRSPRRAFHPTLRGCRAHRAARLCGAPPGPASCGGESALVPEPMRRFSAVVCWFWLHVTRPRPRPRGPRGVGQRYRKRPCTRSPLHPALLAGDYELIQVQSQPTSGVATSGRLHLAPMDSATKAGAVGGPARDLVGWLDARGRRSRVAGGRCLSGSRASRRGADRAASASGPRRSTGRVGPCSDHHRGGARRLLGLVAGGPGSGSQDANPVPIGYCPIRPATSAPCGPAGRMSA